MVFAVAVQTKGLGTRQSNPRYSAARTSISWSPRTTRSPGALPIRARAVHRRGLQPTSSPCHPGLSQPATVRAPHRPTVKSAAWSMSGPRGPLQYRGLRHPAFEPPVDRRARRTKTDIIDVEMLLRTLMAWPRGEPRVCSMVPIPTEADEEARRAYQE